MRGWAATGSAAVADRDDFANQRRQLVVLALDDRLDLRSHLTELLDQRLRGGTGQQRRDHGDDKRTAPDLARRLRGGGSLNYGETFSLESADNLFPLGA